LYHQYLRESKLDKGGLKALLVRNVLHKLRIWDVISANRVDHFIANSKYIKRRIYNIYRRESDVIYPPVDIERFSLKEEMGDYYFTASRMVPYKRIDLIVKAFNKFPEKKLKVAGKGPDFEKNKKIAGDNIEFLGFVSDAEMHSLIGKARAFVFAADEDFGIIPVEAQA
jgi:glycosyltransferase involved in cell wall biosynthesis